MLVREIENKKVIWFERSNRYGVFEPLMADLVLGIRNHEPDESLVRFIKATTYATQKEAENFLMETKKRVAVWNSEADGDTGVKVDLPLPGHFYKKVCYRFHRSLCCIAYGDRMLYGELHQKIAHWETTDTNGHCRITIYRKEEKFVLAMDGERCWTYPPDRFHFLQGRLSMLWTTLAHGKPEKEWMGVFHASAVGNGTSSVLLLGESGSGKSTALALLKAHGLYCIADDFVPMEGRSTHVFPFVGGISVKEESRSVLKGYYDELVHQEFTHTYFRKKVTYLPTYPKFGMSFPCRTLIFIKHKHTNRKLILKELSKIQAFEQLVPDSWLSHMEHHAKQFLSWFNTTASYGLEYADTDELVSTIKQLLNNEL